jgi:hypothetical protein
MFLYITPSNPSESLRNLSDDLSGYLYAEHLVTGNIITTVISYWWNVNCQAVPLCVACTDLETNPLADDNSAFISKQATELYALIKSLLVQMANLCHGAQSVSHSRLQTVVPNDLEPIKFSLLEMNGAVI